MPMAASLVLFSEMHQRQTQTEEATMSCQGGEELTVSNQYVSYTCLHFICYLILKTTIRVRKYYLHFTNEENKAQRVIKDSLINGCDGIQALFFLTRMTLSHKISPQAFSFFFQLFQKKIFAFNNLCVLRMKKVILFIFLQEI